MADATEFDGMRVRRRLLVQFIEQRLRVLQIGGIEALDEPGVDLVERSERLVCLLKTSSRMTHEWAYGKEAGNGRVS
jgi:hypothetical protein